MSAVQAMLGSIGDATVGGRVFLHYF
ncbi:hypothetical protein BQ8794_320059 [Mesorhizobium prunaredense]|uniref:Uncharacterized protein n=1 Tax=Mesorhizobium prunaredense TaxID=1631249 RepID=A0A1R3VBD3_9HYPH|nr:hypothetical protein BQ8794_320059 [Mesorhizobium prunaredense]